MAWSVARCWWQRQNLRHLLTGRCCRATGKREPAYRNIGHHTTLGKRKGLRQFVLRAMRTMIAALFYADPRLLEWLLTTPSRFHARITPVARCRKCRFRG